MFKQIILALLLLMATFRAGAVDYTDIYYTPAEDGWGANVVQSDTFLFVTFFIYGPDNKPTWYTAQLTLDASGNYNGKLYATTGTYFASPWKPVDKTVTEVGTASFQPTSAYDAKLVYVVTTPAALAATVTKSIRRQTLTGITLRGSYFGAQTGTYSGSSCGVPGTYNDSFNLQVDQSTSGTVTFNFMYQGFKCTLSGTLTQIGQLYTVPTTAIQCSDGLNTSASMSEIKATAQGIEGKFTVPSAAFNCREDATFSAVLH